jgi:hypothetical protein
MQKIQVDESSPSQELMLFSWISHRLIILSLSFGRSSNDLGTLLTQLLWVFTLGIFPSPQHVKKQRKVPSQGQSECKGAAVGNDFEVAWQHPALLPTAKRAALLAATRYTTYAIHTQKNSASLSISKECCYIQLGSYTNGQHVLVF